MKYSRHRNSKGDFLSLVLGLAMTGFLISAACPGGGFRPIFNGQNLDGWEGNPQLWSIQDGAITGETTEDSPLDYNQFLIWQGGTLRNFELKLKVRLIGDNNSGIQYRSKLLPEAGDFVVGGYQVDIHPRTEYNGMLYEEKGRGIIAQQSQKVVVNAAGEKQVVGSTGSMIESSLSEWNDYSVVAQGNTLIHKLNGQVTVEVTDDQSEARSLEGLLALQVHQGKPMKVQFKDILLRELPND